MDVLFKNAHIILNKELVAELFASESYVQVIYYESNKTLMIARDSDDMFRSFHKAKRELLKDKNMHGDKSVNIREMVIDYELDETERSLSCFPDKSMHVLNVYFT